MRFDSNQQECTISPLVQIIQNIGRLEQKNVLNSD